MHASATFLRVGERVGVFGGTFDPVHVAHIVVATEARAVLGLDRVLLVVAGDPWQKRGRVEASAA
ncbi:MAG TPA: adenylyltransferase/cytidyltransferase family protein, partial [Acidimicrobiia bacterium]